MRIAILGAGAMGSIYGADLAAAGVDTLMVDVNRTLVDRLNGEGIRIRRDGAERVARVPATTDPAGERPADLVMVFVKSFATDPAMRLAAPLVGEQTLVLSLQNGWGNGEMLAAHVAAERVLVGITYHSAAVSGPGVVDHTAAGKTVLGPYRNPDLGDAERVAAAFDAAGIATEVTAGIEERIWRKLLLNLAANPVAALTGLRSDGLLATPTTGDLMAAITRETVAVANAEGHAFEADEAIAYIRASLKAAGTSMASMLQDVKAGRPTEIETITGAVVRAAERHGIPVPTNRAIYALVKGYEASRA
jgi:2-dehydropantoate 2-reductase